MKRTPLLICTVCTFVLITFAASCSSREKSAGKHSGGELIPGTIHTFACKGYPGHNYVVYVPQAKPPVSGYPVVYALDAHARGCIAVERLKSCAEHLGYVIAGSNTIRNNMPDYRQAAQIMFADLESRVAVDKSRVYIIGFSGGARMAADLASVTPGVVGVGACAAGFSPAQRSENPFEFYGLVGDEDFNYLEMTQMANALSSWAKPWVFDVFDGGHHWPDNQMLEDVLLWFHLNAMRQRIIPPDIALIDSTKQAFHARIEQAKGGDAILYGRALMKCIQFLDGLTDMTQYQADFSTLIESKAYKDAETRESAFLAYESSLQNLFASSFDAKDLAWWESQIELLRPVDRSKLNYKSRKRSMAYISMLGYIFVERALREGNVDKAAKYLSIYESADSLNADCMYFRAKLFALRGQEAEALTNLNQAADNGYFADDVVKGEQIWSSYASEPSYQDAVAKITANRLCR